MKRALSRVVVLVIMAGALSSAAPYEVTAAEPVVGGQAGPQAGSQEAEGIDPTYGCLICHADKRRAYLLGVHSDRSVRCHDCHGGDPNAFEMPEAHSGDFRGVLGKLATVEVCSECHGDPDAMRQYGLPADQVAELRTSQHGHLLLEEASEDAPTCSDCHDPHTTLRSDDARSSAYPLNIPTLCAVCHEDGQAPASPFELSPYVPGNVLPQGIVGEGLMPDGDWKVSEDGRLLFARKRPVAEAYPAPQQTSTGGSTRP